MNTIDPIQIRHPKESTYVTIMYVFSIIIYVIISIPLLLSFVVAIPFLLLFFVFTWLISLFFRAQILGDTLKISDTQFPELYNSLTRYCEQTNISKIPEMFVFNSNGMLNAFAIKLFMKKYIMLTSSIVDLSYKNNNFDELNFIIGHEVGHHAAGHTSYKRMFLTYPAGIIPFLGAAYSRACELTADRYGLVLSGKRTSSLNSLVNLAHGSRYLSEKINIQAFEQQENEIPEFMGFVAKLWSTHPRLTIRVSEIKNYNFEQMFNIQAPSQNHAFNSYTQPLSQNLENQNKTLYNVQKQYSNCPNCRSEIDNDAVFCEHCGFKLK